MRSDRESLSLLSRESCLLVASVRIQAVGAHQSTSNQKKVAKMQGRRGVLFLLVTAFTFGRYGCEAFQGLPVLHSNTRQRQVIILLSNEAPNFDENDPRNALGRQIRGLKNTGMKKTMEPGDMVICKREIASMGIFENKSYELQSIYAQRFQEETQTTEKLPLESIETPVPSGYDRYIQLFSPVYHEESVVVTAEEVGLASVRSELSLAALLAVPGMFWVAVAYSFYSVYHERTGGSFLDAFWGK